MLFFSSCTTRIFMRLNILIGCNLLVGFFFPILSLKKNFAKNFPVFCIWKQRYFSYFKWYHLLWPSCQLQQVEKLSSKELKMPEIEYKKNNNTSIAHCRHRRSCWKSKRCLHKLSRSVKFLFGLMMHSNKKISQIYKRTLTRTSKCNPLSLSISHFQPGYIMGHCRRVHQDKSSNVFEQLCVKTQNR